MGVLAVLGVLCVVAVNALAPRLRLPAPLLLGMLGVLISLQPVVAPPIIEVEPEAILAGVLPLLLYAAAVSMPASNFRRDLRTISALSIVLVVLSAVALGLFFRWQVPSLGLAGGIALGAVLSPTDAVATSIVKKLGVAPRAVAVLDGEAMLNDASALVLLRSSIAAMASTVSLWHVVGSFAKAVALAAVLGTLVGHVALRLRRKIAQPIVSTLLSFAVPFIAYFPAEHFGASGLVSVVAAGLVIGKLSPRYLSPVHRITEELNWTTVEMLLEGGLFLVMGVELTALMRDVSANNESLGFALGLAGAALGITLAVRAAYVVPLVFSLRRLQRRYEAFRAKLEILQRELDEPHEPARNDERVRTRVRRVLADADYVRARPIGGRDGALLVWAGMRGAITLAAAQTLPHDFPQRSLVVLVSFLVAGGSLLLQGGTLAFVVRLLRFPAADPASVAHERGALEDEIEAAGLRVLDDPALASADGSPYEAKMLERMRDRLVRARRELADAKGFEDGHHLLDQVFDAQRRCVLAARDDGRYSAEALAEALEVIDNLQLSMQLAHNARADD